jgi:SOS response regulatory protein OraA/RecX
VRDLQSQGVDRRVAEGAVRQSLAAEGVDPVDAVRALAEKRARQLAGLPPAVRKRRLSAFLARRGFEAQQIWEVVESLNS